jgi:hypothetical protein
MGTTALLPEAEKGSASSAYPTSVFESSPTDPFLIRLTMFLIKWKRDIILWSFRLLLVASIAMISYNTFPLWKYQCEESGIDLKTCFMKGPDNLSLHRPTWPDDEYKRLSNMAVWLDLPWVIGMLIGLMVEKKAGLFRGARQSLSAGTPLHSKSLPADSFSIRLILFLIKWNRDIVLLGLELLSCVSIWKLGSV